MNAINKTSVFFYSISLISDQKAIVTTPLICQKPHVQKRYFYLALARAGSAANFLKASNYK